MSTKIIHPFHLVDESTLFNLAVSVQAYFTKILSCSIPLEIEEFLKKLFGSLICFLGVFVVLKILLHFLIMAIAGTKPTPLPKPDPDCFLQIKIAEVSE